MLRRLSLLTALALLLSALPHSNVPVAAGQAPVASRNGKKFRATRPIVVDAQTGAARLPDEQELTALVAQLDALAARPENLTPTSAGGVMKVDLADGYAGVLLARPDGRGGYETQCVFSFEEGAAFLGLVDDGQ